MPYQDIVTLLTQLRLRHRDALRAVAGRDGSQYFAHEEQTSTSVLGSPMMCHSTTSPVPGVK